jgi:hypothetical protein
VAAARQLRAAGFPDAEPAFAHACYEATGGNPFLMERLASDLVARGARPDEESAPAVLEFGPGSATTSVLV